MARAPRTPPAAPSAGVPARRRTLGVPDRGTRPAKIFTSSPVSIEFAGPEHRYYRADLELDGIYHGEASYEGRIFLNNPGATEQTATTSDNGYAGSFYIFGHGGCLGDPGHCEVHEDARDPYDMRYPHPLTPARKYVTVTNTLREIAKTAKTITVTVVPVVTAINELCDPENVFRCEDMHFITYDP